LDTCSIILAGGKSLRLGHDKVFETVGNASLLQQVISRISPVCRNIIVVISGERSFPQLSRYSNCRTVTDVFPGKGPLGGIYTGLVASDSTVNLVVACDMPFLNQKLLRYLIKLSTKYDLVVPQINGYSEPLHAVYKKSCIAPIEKLIKQENLRIYDFYNSVKIRYVSDREIDKFDPGHQSFFNINTTADLKLARKIAKGNN
jgi:molybdopterin-guanine dinucleotide biosynthesis protein A